MEEHGCDARGLWASASGRCSASGRPADRQSPAPIPHRAGSAPVRGLLSPRGAALDPRHRLRRVVRPRRRRRRVSRHDAPQRGQRRAQSRSRSRARPREPLHLALPREGRGGHLVREGLGRPEPSEPGHAPDQRLLPRVDRQRRMDEVHGLGPRTRRLRGQGDVLVPAERRVVRRRREAGGRLQGAGGDSGVPPLEPRPHLYDHVRLRGRTRADVPLRQGQQLDVLRVRAGR